jgi:diguanylate cyclase (GGDEF)-like protein
MSRHPFLKGVHTPGIRMSLAVLVVGCILPIAGMAAFLIFDFYEHEQTQLTMNAISRARAMTSVVDRDFAIAQAALLALSTSPLLTKDDLRGFHAEAVEALRNMQAETIMVLDTTGQLLLTTARPFGEPLPKLANPPLLKRTLEAGKPGVSDLFVGPLAGRLILTIAVPVKRDGSTIYSLNATVAPAQLSSVLTEQKLPDSWRAAIIDSTGSVVARTHEVEKFLGKKVNLDLLQRISISDEDSFESKTLDGIPVFTVYSRSPVTKWTVALGVPLDELTAGLHQTLVRLIVATFGALVIGLSLAWFIGGRVARSITALTKPARALGSGVVLTIPHLHFKEANEMRQALLDAATTLQQANYESHHDVLTGLANRALFHIVVNGQLALCRRSKTALAILYIDLDGFKTVNDTYGHATGDQLLLAVSIRIKGAIRDSDIAARLGGDEFSIALVDCNLDDAIAFAGRLIEIISDPYQLGEIEAKISASIGVSGYPISATDFDTLLKNADHAMYRAKGLGKRRVCASTQ